MALTHYLGAHMADTYTHTHIHTHTHTHTHLPYTVYEATYEASTYI